MSQMNIGHRGVAFLLIVGLLASRQYRAVCRLAVGRESSPDAFQPSL